MQLLNFDSVVLLSPHPDDIEVSMGGTIMKYQDTFFNSIVFSTGSVHDPVANDDRWKECDAYWKDLDNNLKQYFLAPLLDMYSEEEWINLLEERFDFREYQALFLPPNLDTHYEHRFVNLIGMALTRNIPISVIEYRAISAMDTWIPNMFIETSEFVKEKVKRLVNFRSQNKSYFKPKYMQAFHSHINSVKKHIDVTEQFKITTLYNL